MNLDMRISPEGYAWGAADLARRTKEFLGMSRLLYHDCEVRPLEITENCVLAKDRGGVERMIMREDMSYSSWYICCDNLRAFVTIKVRCWK